MYFQQSLDVHKYGADLFLNTKFSSFSQKKKVNLNCLPKSSFDFLVNIKFNWTKSTATAGNLPGKVENFSQRQKNPVVSCSPHRTLWKKRERGLMLTFFCSFLHTLNELLHQTVSVLREHKQGKSLGFAMSQPGWWKAFGVKWSQKTE